jgi:hypothetical protein
MLAVGLGCLFSVGLFVWWRSYRTTSLAPYAPTPEQWDQMSNLDVLELGQRVYGQFQASTLDDQDVTSLRTFLSTAVDESVSDTSPKDREEVLAKTAEVIYMRFIQTDPGAYRRLPDLNQTHRGHNRVVHRPTFHGTILPGLATEFGLAGIDF